MGSTFPISRARLEKIIIGLKGSLWSLLFPFRRSGFRSKRIVACLYTIGERTEGQALSSIRNQTIEPSLIEIIRDISPISRACNRGLDAAADADYLLAVDSDMILSRDCIESLLALSRPDVLCAVAPLLDPVYGRVGYVKLFNMHIIRKTGVRYRDVIGCDVDFISEAGRADPSVILESYTITRKPLGVHHPTYTARELYRKIQIERKKRGNRMSPALVRTLTKKYHETGSLVILAGILGERLPNPDTSSGESFPDSGLLNWPEVERLIGPVPEDLEYGFGPEFIRKRVH